jgi:hypothetical protein
MAKKNETNVPEIDPIALFAGFDPKDYILTVMDGYDDCIVGVIERFGQDPVVCYDKEKVLKKLEADGMSRDEAVEWFYFNQIGAWVGETTPCFLSINFRYTK